ncbi:hypothetical protein NE634_12765 [Lacrimispora saccharolytica]|nr:hypothetical protein [Lacrimispora saccharolytica]
MLKGKSVIELTDVHTGKKERYEDTNLVTEAAMDILNCNIKGMLYNSTTFNGASGDDWMLPLKKNIMGGILLYQNALEERADNIYAPLNNPLIGYASDDANNTEDIRRGSRNLTESKEVDGGYRFVWDFATSQANGTISAICLSNTLAGKGTQYAGNYMPATLQIDLMAVVIVSKEEFKNEKLYQTTMYIARQMLAEGLISEEEYRQINIIFTEKYKPTLGTLFADIDLL